MGLTQRHPASPSVVTVTNTNTPNTLSDQPGDGFQWGQAVKGGYSSTDTSLEVARDATQHGPWRPSFRWGLALVVLVAVSSLALVHPASGDGGRQRVMEQALMSASVRTSPPSLTSRPQSHIQTNVPCNPSAKQWYMTSPHAAPPCRTPHTHSLPSLALVYINVVFP